MVGFGRIILEPLELDVLSSHLSSSTTNAVLEAGHFSKSAVFIQVSNGDASAAMISESSLLRCGEARVPCGHRLKCGHRPNHVCARSAKILALNVRHHHS